MAETTDGSLNSASQQETEKEATEEVHDTEEAISAGGSEVITPIQEIEILSEQFQNYLVIAQAIMKTLKRPKDIEICANLLRKVQRVNLSNEAKIKRQNNIFFQYCLRVLKWTSENQPIELYQYWYRDQGTSEVVHESSTWLEENKSYMSLTRLNDGTTVIYCAIAEDPTSNWQDGGLNLLAKVGNCPKVKQF